MLNEQEPIGAGENDPDACVARGEEPLLENPEEEYPRLIDLVMRGAVRDLTRDDLRALFGDYAVLIERIAHEAGPIPVRELAAIDTPVATNLLRHVCDLPDLVSRGVVEVDYDSEHPTGEDTVEQVLSREHQRESARRALARRGDPDYAAGAFLSGDCWTIPTPGATPPVR